MKTKRITYLFASLIVLSQLGCNNIKPQEMDSMQIIDSTYHSLGEGAFWDHENNRLFFVDIIGKKLYEFYPETGKKNAHSMPSMIGTVVAEGEKSVIVALEDGVYRYDLDSKELEFLACPPENDSTQRFNDGKCDPAGRLWVGTMSLIGGKKTSHLFCMKSESDISISLDSITISNGIVWSSDQQKMYYIDTPTRKVMEYVYDKASGSISKPRVAVQVHDSLGAPDGMAIDAEDHLWVCMWGGSAVCKFDPATGNLLKQVKVPARNVTSCTFGGKYLNELYITTARIGTSDEALNEYPSAGALFKIITTEKGALLSHAKLK